MCGSIREIGVLPCRRIAQQISPFRQAQFPPKSDYFHSPRAEVGSREQRSRTFAARRRNPPAYRPLGDTEGDGDLPLLPTELLEAPGLHSPPLSPVLRVGALGVHALFYGPKNFTFLRNAQ